MCVTCGLTRVRRQRLSVRLKNGRTVNDVDAEVCAACGERYYDLVAMRELEAAAARAR